MTALEEFRDRSTILGRIEDVPRGASEGQVSGGFLGGEVGGERGKEGERKVSFLRRLEIRWKEEKTDMDVLCYTLAESR